MTTTSSASRLSSQEQAQLIYQILSDVYDKSPWTLEQVGADLALDTTEYFYVYNQEEVVGFLALQNLVGEIEVTNIAVLKAYQGIRKNYYHEPQEDAVIMRREEI